MKKCTVTWVIRLVVSLAIVMALLPAAVLADEVTPAPTTVSGDVAPGGGKLIVSFPYSGDKSTVLLTLNFWPGDIFTNRGIALELYSPAWVKIDTAGARTELGLKRALMSSTTAGDYIVVVTNWDPLGRTVNIALTSTHPKTGTAGPGLTLVSPAPAPTPVPAVTPTPTPVAVVPAVTPTPEPAPTTVSGDVAPGGGKLIVSFPYSGDKSTVLLTLNFWPGDIFTNRGIALELYSPAWVKIDTAGARTELGLKRALMSSTTAGDYIVVVTNWDPLGRTVNIALTSTHPKTGTAGPGLTLVK